MNERYSLGVVPSLLSFPTIALPADVANQLLIGSLLTAFYIDYHLFMQGTLPPWYFRLRVMLTLGATTSYAIAEFYRLRAERR